MSELARIRAARIDISDWVIHRTSTCVVEGKHLNALETLQHILQCGQQFPLIAL